MKISMFHNGGDFSYLYGLISSLSKLQGIVIDIIDSEQSVIPFQKLKNVYVYKTVLPFKNKFNPFYRIYRILKPYLKAVIYTIKTDSKLFHIQWFNRLKTIDRLFLINFYHILNKKVIYTAHNVNTLKRNMKDNFWNRSTLKYFYKKVDHIIVHNQQSKRELQKEFKVNLSKVSVMRFGLNVFSPQSGIKKDVALRNLGLPMEKKIILFFGAVNVYKGLEFLIDAYANLIKKRDDIHLVVAGESRDANYFNRIKEMIIDKIPTDKVSSFFEYIPEDKVEDYFTSADCVVLPYKSISQSGVHFLSYSFGVPVIASDVGSFKEEDIVEGKTGFVCRAEDPADLELAINKYFNSELFNNLEENKINIRKWAQETYSWEIIALRTFECYKQVLEK